MENKLILFNDVFINPDKIISIEKINNLMLSNPKYQIIVYLQNNRTYKQVFSTESERDDALDILIRKIYGMC